MPWLPANEPQMAFNHEKLKVYQRSLPFNAKVGEWDLCGTQSLLSLNDVVGWKALLESVSVMTSSMIAGMQR